MHVDVNADAVEEVFALAKSDQLLRAVEGAPVDRALSLKQAKLLAWENTTGGEGYTWTDIREMEMARIRQGSFDQRGEQCRQALTKRGKSLLLRLRRQLVGEHAELLDDVYADLMNCAMTRALHGVKAGLMEDIFQAYRSGGWPCGWKGDYPSGELVVYYPIEPEMAD